MARVDAGLEHVGPEPLFRAVNERIRGISEAFGLITGSVTLVCECAELACLAQIDLTLEDYEAVRADPSQFVVATGHEAAGVDSVVMQRGGFAVVRKQASAPPLRERPAPDASSG